MNGRFVILDRATGEMIEIPDWRKRQQIERVQSMLTELKHKRPSLALTDNDADDLARALFGEAQ